MYEIKHIKQNAKTFVFRIIDFARKRENEKQKYAEKLNATNKQLDEFNDFSVPSAIILMFFSFQYAHTKMYKHTHA